MKAISVVLYAALMGIVGCAGTDSHTIEDVPGPTAINITITPVGIAIAPGSQTQLTAVVRNNKGNVLSGTALTWSIQQRHVGKVTTSGLFTALTPGNSIVTVTNPSSGTSATGTITVVSPTVSRGSLVGIGGVTYPHLNFQFAVSTIVSSDTSANGSEHLIGIIHVSGANSISSMSRSDFPQFSAVDRCEDGRIYGASFSTENQGITLYRIDGATAVATQIIQVGGPGRVNTIGCMRDNSIIYSVDFAGLTDVYRLDLGTNRVQLIRAAAVDYISGVAQSSAGLTYATSYNAFDPAPQGQLLSILNVSSGTLTSVQANQPKRFPRAQSIDFRGNRLLGIAGGAVVEFSVLTGVAQQIRELKPLPSF